MFVQVSSSEVVVLCADSGDEYVYDLYAVNEKIDETDTSYPFPLYGICVFFL